MATYLATDDDRLIWGLPSGTVLTCQKAMVMEGSGDVAFAEGKTYTVASMHPIAEPAFVRLVDDQGKTHRLEAGDVRNYFGR